MKSIKRISCLFLAVFAVLSVLAVSASAASYRATDDGAGSGYTWNSALTTTNTTGSAYITVRVGTSGVVPTKLSVSLKGYVYTKGEDKLRLSASNSGTAVPTLSASNTRTANTGDEVIGADCDYTAMGAAAGRKLTVGTTW